MNNRQIEDDFLLNTYLNKKFFYIKNKQKNKHVELIIRPECNQKCEYCYITKYGHDLYPLETRKSKEEIIHNIDMLLKYLLEDKKATILCWDLFAGDLFYDNIWFDIMDLFIKYYNTDYYQKEFLLDKKVKIVLPCNLSFLEDDIKTKRFEDYLIKLQEIKIDFHISYSTDGLYAVDSREKKSLNQKWFDKTLSFCAKHNFGLHPMVSHENIDNYIQNYKWWIENVNKYFDPQKQMWSPMFLQVRNDGWTDEKIDKYIDLLEYMINFRLELFDNNLYDFAMHITQEKDHAYKLLLPPADLISFKTIPFYSNSINCSLPVMLFINCNTLEITPCHRLTYKQFNAGKFVVEENKITRIEAEKGLSSYLNIVENNRFFRPECAYCELQQMCIRGCMGAQFEYIGDPFKNIPSVCNFFKRTYGYLINKYKELGVLDIILDPNFKNYSEEMAKMLHQYLKFTGRE